VVAGDIDMAWSPTPPVINQVSNADVPLVALYGMPNPDWVIGTTEAGKTCKDLAGQDVAVDSINGARSVALRSMLTGCPGVKIENIKQVALGSGPGPALLAGRLQYAVLHLDDLSEIEAQGKKLNILLAMKNTNPTSHYLILVARKDKLKADRDAYVRAVAGMIDAAHFMADPKNADTVAQVATNTGHSKEVNKEALKAFLARDYTERNALEVVLGIGAYTMATLANRLTGAPIASQAIVSATRTRRIHRIGWRRAVTARPPPPDLLPRGEGNIFCSFEALPALAKQATRANQ